MASDSFSRLFIGRVPGTRCLPPDTFLFPSSEFSGDDCWQHSLTSIKTFEILKNREQCSSGLHPRFANRFIKDRDPYHLRSVRMSRITLLDLPNELILQIVDHLGEQRYINPLTRLNQRFHDILNDHLYHFNILTRGSDGLLWAAKYDRLSTARRLLHLGANVNARINYTTGRIGLTPLHHASEHGHLKMARMLLDVGANPEARAPAGWTPLYNALVFRHEEVAKAISDRIGDLKGCLVYSVKKFTPLHLASAFALFETVRLCLRAGVEVDAKDWKGKTALWHILNGGEGVHDGENPYGAKEELDSNQVLRTVRLLLDYGADQDIVVNEGEGMVGMAGEKTVRMFGAGHDDPKVRELFSRFSLEDSRATKEEVYFPGSPVSDRKTAEEHEVAGGVDER
jgi:ankyrin repeat protein